MSQQQRGGRGGGSNSGDGGLGESAMGLLIVIVVLGMIIAIGGAFVGAVLFGGDVVEFAPEPGETITLEDTDEVPSDATVRLSQERAVAFGGDGYLEAEGVGELNGSWTVCTVVVLADDANQNLSYHVFSAAETDIQLQYDGQTDGGPYWLAYYDNETNGDVVVRADAVTPTERTAVCARFDAANDTVSVAVDGDIEATGAPGDGGVRYLAGELDGGVDEIRVTNNAVGDARFAEYAAEPTVAWPDEDRVARLMFNEGSGESTYVYFADVSATLVNVEWVDGVESATLAEGDDYEFSVDPWAVTPLAGGLLDGAPVAFVESSVFGLGFSDALDSIFSMTAIGITIFAVGLVLIPAVAIVIYLRESELGEIGGFRR